MKVPYLYLIPLMAGLAPTSSQAAVTLVSGYSSFSSNGGGVVESNLGGSNLSFSLPSNGSTVNPNGSLTVPQQGSGAKTSINISSLNLSKDTGFTINLNFLSATNLDNQDSLFCLSTSNNQNAYIGRYENTNKVGMAVDGSTGGRPGEAVSSVIDFTQPFSLTLSVSGGKTSIFVTSGGITQEIFWNNKTNSGTPSSLILGAWGSLDGNRSGVTLSGISFWEGAATMDDITGIINVPEPGSASLALLGIGGIMLRRKRTR